MRMCERSRCNSVTAASENRLTSMRRLSTRPGADACYRLSDYQVDELPGHDDLLDDLLAVEMALDGLGASGQLQQLGLWGTHRRLDARPEPPVDLDHQRERVALEQRGVGLRPRLLPDTAAVDRLEYLGGEVRGEREDQRRRGGDGEAQCSLAVRVPVEPVLEPIRVVDELHDGRNRGVEREAALDVPRDLVDRKVASTEEGAGVPGKAVGGRAAIVAGRRPRPLDDLPREAPQARQEAMHALQALVGPIRILVGGADEQNVGASRVRSVAFDVGGRIDHIALRLGHLRPLAGDHPDREEGLERLLDVEEPDVGERLDEEARV